MVSIVPTKLDEFLHMKAGDGEFSYAHNTLIQTQASNRSRLIIEKGVNSLLSDEIIRPGEGDRTLRVADVGCGIGPDPLNFVSIIMDLVQNKFKELRRDDDDDQLPELQIYLNDLPSNDFNLLFKDLAVSRRGKTPLCFLMGVPGSFHTRLFPRNSLHFMYSNFALHWLSQTPIGLHNKEGTSSGNRSSIYISETSAPTTIKTYVTQFIKVWTSILRYRSEEMVEGGRVIIVVRGRPSMCLHPIWEIHLLGLAIASLVSQGIIDEEKLETFNFPVYIPSSEEIKEVVKEEGSFEIEHIETQVNEIVEEFKDNDEKAQSIAKCIQSFSESVVAHHFGDQVLAKLYSELTRVTLEYVAATESSEVRSIILLLKKSIS